MWIVSPHCRSSELSLLHPLPIKFNWCFHQLSLRVAMCSGSVSQHVSLGSLSAVLRHQWVLSPCLWDHLVSGAHSVVLVMWCWWRRDPRSSRKTAEFIFACLGKLLKTTLSSQDEGNKNGVRHKLGLQAAKQCKSTEWRLNGSRRPSAPAKDLSEVFLPSPQNRNMN